MILGNIMVLDYNQQESQAIVEYFQESGYSVVSCAQAEDAIKQLKDEKHKISLLIYKMSMTNRSGYEILDKVRLFSEMPIIVLSEDNRLDSQLYAYSKKIDDYMVEPVILPLLEAHVEAVLRRCAEKKVYEEKIGEMTIDYESRKILLRDHVLKVTTKEFDLLEYFVRHRGMVLSRDKILDAVWGYDYIGGYRSVDTLVKKLRAKMGKDFPYIKTIYGVGYSFDVIF